MHHVLVANLAGSEGKVGHLQQQEPGDEILTEAIVPDDAGTECGNGRSQQRHR